MNNEIKDEINKRKIINLCHVTHAGVLPYILGNPNNEVPTGIVPPEKIINNPIFKALPTHSYRPDSQRKDGRLDCSSLSITIPNFFYLDNKEKNDLTEENAFQDWVILLIDPCILYNNIDISNKVIYCNGNAASKKTSKEKGINGLKNLFNKEVRNKRVSLRSDKLPKVPTDLQAEILYPGCIDSSYIKGIIFKSEEMARNELEKLAFCDVDLNKYINKIGYSEEFFNSDISNIVNKIDNENEFTYSLLYKINDYSLYF